MRLLLDANLSPRLIEPMTAAGYDVTHVGDIGLLHATDSVIFDRAFADGYVIVTADSDFPMLVAISKATARLTRSLEREGPAQRGRCDSRATLDVGGRPPD